MAVVQNNNLPVTSEALQEAKKVADEILEPRAVGALSEKTVVHQHYHDSWYWRPYFYTDCYQPCYSRPLCEPSRREKENNRWLILPILIVSLPLLAFFGDNLARIRNMNRKLDQLTLAKNNVKPELKGNASLKEKVEQVLQKQEEILTEQKSGTKIKLGLQGVLATSLGSLGFWAFNNSNLAFNLGAAGVVASVGAMLFRAGFSAGDTSLAEKATSLNHTIDTASKEAGLRA